VVRWIVVAAVILLGSGSADAQRDWFELTAKNRVRNLNNRIAGRVVDLTRNHDCDRRLYCPSLGEKRDLYIYLPPGYDGRTPFPGLLWLHAIAQDEKPFLDLVMVIDDGIRAGRLPPMIVAAPDGSIRGRAGFFNTGSFYLNGAKGNFEDYVIHDVWEFVNRNFAVHPHRNARVIAGASMGGFGAFNLGIKHREKFGHLVGIMPPLNLRYSDCHGSHRTDYDPDCFQLKTTHRRREVVARLYGVFFVRSRRLMDPVVGRRHPDPTGFIAAENPYEMLTAYDVRPGEFGMFIGYGTEDEFNIDAQVESFLDAAAARGIRPAVVTVHGGRHNLETALKMFPAFGHWLWQQVGAHVPPGYGPDHPCCPTHCRPDTTSR
jgi:S-formylglutathione hydrolase FrmB